MAKPKLKPKPAARVTDNVVHLTPPTLTGILKIATGSPNVFIGKLKAWRGVPTAAVPALVSVKQTNDVATISSTIASISGMADKHVCGLHGIGVVVGGSRTVLINGLPACRKGDIIIEPLGPPNIIAKGCLTVFIGD